MAFYSNSDNLVSGDNFGSANLAGSDALDTTIYGNGINGLDLIAVVQDVTNVPVENLVFFT
ncbi:MAG: hypothetical protein U7123_06325 [Potamolinea sp.]